MKIENYDFNLFNSKQLTELKDFLTYFSSLSMYKRLKFLSKLNVIIEHKKSEESEEYE